jgi:hypothetical protein
VATKSSTPACRWTCRQDTKAVEQRVHLGWSTIFCCQGFSEDLPKKYPRSILGVISYIKLFLGFQPCETYQLSTYIKCHFFATHTHLIPTTQSFGIIVQGPTSLDVDVVTVRVLRGNSHIGITSSLVKYANLRHPEENQDD